MVVNYRCCIVWSLAVGDLTANNGNQSCVKLLKSKIFFHRIIDRFGYRR